MNSSAVMVSVTVSFVVATFVRLSHPSGNATPSPAIRFGAVLFDAIETAVILGFVLSAITDVPSVTLVTSMPALPATSQYVTLKVTFPFMSTAESVNVLAQTAFAPVVSTYSTAVSFTALTMSTSSSKALKPEPDPEPDDSADTAVFTVECRT